MDLRFYQAPRVHDDVTRNPHDNITRSHYTRRVFSRLQLWELFRLLFLTMSCFLCYSGSVCDLT